ncbi:MULTISPECIES: PH domain-containing protein [unclassified Staphylococcus]|uniref:PH domain-containing protein n=1 Tax=unclassified Staphylococcus TaxID=91994 RepID=UPI0021D018CE|nr:MULTISPECIES: PH domain-containing protein [unclassified Staphylococcus]UXR77845.1 PH domain-containing protein [Staphylococcus sp. IVB6227]UXR82006.1 PH domain-containing protein [Staphylococcus sp. IVB6214]
MTTSFQRSPEVAKKYFRQFYLLRCLIGTVLLIIAFSLDYYFEVWQPLQYIAGGLLVLHILYCLLKPYFRYHFTYYRIKENVIEVKRNYWFRKHQILKVERLQYLHWENGPLLRRYQLQRLILTTAGHAIQLPLLYEEDVHQLEQYCLEQLQEGDSDV